MPEIEGKSIAFSFVYWYYDIVFQVRIFTLQRDSAQGGKVLGTAKSTSPITTQDADKSVESPVFQNVYEALLDFQKAEITLTKDKKVQAGARKYSYVDINQVLEKTQPELNERGCVLYDKGEPGDGRDVLETILLHVASGTSISTTMSLLMTQKDMQGLGSAISYARRYNRIGLLGLQQEDDDAASIQVDTRQPTTPAQPQANVNRPAPPATVGSPANRPVAPMPQRPAAVNGQSSLRANDTNGVSR